MDSATLAWLRTEDGAALLDLAARALAEHPRDPVAAATAVRRHEADADRASAALTQAALRTKAVAKFDPDDAARMFFAPDALEQATHHRVATHRASRLALAAPGGSVVDLGCGIGGDLIACARAGLVAAGVDADPLRAEIADANLRALGLPGAAVHARAEGVELDTFDLAYVDPARRGARGRVFDVEGWTPAWSFVLEVLARRGVAKLAPGIPHALVPEGAEAEWVSVGGEVKEAAVWSPALATAARRATVIPGDTGGLATLTEEDDPGAGVRPVGRFLYEPDGAVIRAGLVTAVAAGVDGGLVDEHIAYVTSDAPYVTPFARSYQVLEELPYREKALKAALVARGVGPLTIKKRGVDVVPDQLRKRLGLRGDVPATIVLTRVAGKGTALLVRDLPVA